MKWLVRGLTSSVGLKFLMAVSGILLVLFLLGHIQGNLRVFLGEESLNTYAEHLQALGGLLWVMRLGLLGVFALHVLTGTVLWWKNRKARPVPYDGYAPLKSTFFSRTMIYTGALTLVFLVYHLLHFTFRTTGAHVVMDGDHVNVYAMVIHAFREPSIAIPYIAAMILLGFHLYHGIGSFFQSMGWNDPKYEGLWQGLGKTLATLIVIGNVAMPLFVLLGLVGEGVK